LTFLQENGFEVVTAFPLRGRTLVAPRTGGGEPLLFDSRIGGFVAKRAELTISQAGDVG
jgi:hypothetical protein